MPASLVISSTQSPTTRSIFMWRVEEADLERTQLPRFLDALPSLRKNPRSILIIYRYYCLVTSCQRLIRPPEVEETVLSSWRRKTKPRVWSNLFFLLRFTFFILNLYWWVNYSCNLLWYAIDWIFNVFIKLFYIVVYHISFQ